MWVLLHALGAQADALVRTNQRSRFVEAWILAVFRFYWVRNLADHVSQVPRRVGIIFSSGRDFQNVCVK